MGIATAIFLVESGRFFRFLSLLLILFISTFYAFFGSVLLYA